MERLPDGQPVDDLLVKLANGLSNHPDGTKVQVRVDGYYTAVELHGAADHRPMYWSTMSSTGGRATETRP